MKKLFALLMLSLAWNAGRASARPPDAASTRNDDSCDIALLPAATLLLPYFEVDLEDPDGSTTLFTITNITNTDQIARVTLWTDRSYPVIDFNIYLTGYDVQSINLYDVIVRGVIAPENGTGTALQKRGKYSDRNTSIHLAACDRLPGYLDSHYIQRMQLAFTVGNVPDIGAVPGCNDIGNTHENAIGYATIDVMRACTDSLPSDARYWTNDVGYANVLIGDYQHVQRNTRFADGGPMVHIRAVPEGGLTPPVFPRTFYSRFQSAATPKLDARQPLPSVLAARWIYGGPTTYRTFLKVWREGNTGSASQCAGYAQNAELTVQELIVFDEAENSVVDVPRCELQCFKTELPATSMTSVRDSDIFPQLGNGAVAGWVFLNLDQPDDELASQGWVTSSMRAEGQFSVDQDAIALGNGCSRPVTDSEMGLGEVVIGPLPNVRNPQ